MAQKDGRGVEALSDAPQSNALGAFIRKARQDVSMSLRDVEEATNKEVSNGYLSQLESGKITKPSPPTSSTQARSLFEFIEPFYWAPAALG